MNHTKAKRQATNFRILNIKTQKKSSWGANALRGGGGGTGAGMLKPVQISSAVMEPWRCFRPHTAGVPREIYRAAPPAEYQSTCTSSNALAPNNLAWYCSSRLASRLLACLTYISLSPVQRTVTACGTSSPRFTTRNFFKGKKNVSLMTTTQKQRKTTPKRCRAEEELCRKSSTCRTFFKETVAHSKNLQAFLKVE